jgi:hypothetical protein
MATNPYFKEQAPKRRAMHTLPCFDGIATQLIHYFPHRRAFWLALTLTLSLTGTIQMDLGARPARTAGRSYVVPTSRSPLVGPRASVRPIICSDLSPASRTMILPTPFGAGPMDRRVFGETPKTAVETTALPKATASFRP